MHRHLQNHENKQFEEFLAMQSTCIKCGGMQFELSDSHLKRLGTKLAFVQCKACGGVVGIVEVPVTDDVLSLDDKSQKPEKDSYQLEL